MALLATTGEAGTKGTGALPTTAGDAGSGPTQQATGTGATPRGG